MGRYPDEVMGAYRRQLDDPTTIEAICEDYRAGASIDRVHDDADRGVRTIDCPTLCLWGSRGGMELFYGDVLAVWREWTPSVTGRAIDATHFLAEDAPNAVAAELTTFFSAPPGG